MKPRFRSRIQSVCLALPVGILMLGTIAVGQEIRWMPIRSAPLGSPAGTVGAAINATFNTSLGCWELRVSAGGIEVDFDLQAHGWGQADCVQPPGLCRVDPGDPCTLPADCRACDGDADCVVGTCTDNGATCQDPAGGGSGAACINDLDCSDPEACVGRLAPCTLGAIQATVIPAGYVNGLGGDLTPKGWPGTRGSGAYQAYKTCVYSGFPCTGPFDPRCRGGIVDIPECFPNPDWIMPTCADDLNAIRTAAQDYAWATVAQHDCNIDDGSIKTMGGLILNVPNDAAGTYLIGLNPDPNHSFMTNGAGRPIPDVEFTPACITIAHGTCCLDTDADGLHEECQVATPESYCDAAGGLFLGEGDTCTGIRGACCLDSNADGYVDACILSARDCCEAEGGSFGGNGSTCSRIVGACFLDSDHDGFDDTCLEIDRTCCTAVEGSFRGGETTCGELGACCLDLNDNQFVEDLCVEIDEFGCHSQGGSFLGIGSVCEGDQDGDGNDDACERLIPAVSQWGLIVLALLLLAVGKVSFRRRRQA